MELIQCSPTLRSNPLPQVRSVFINKDLTPAAAYAAFLERQTKRARATKVNQNRLGSLYSVVNGAMDSATKQLSHPEVVSAPIGLITSDGFQRPVNIMPRLSDGNVSPSPSTSVISQSPTQHAASGGTDGNMTALSSTTSSAPPPTSAAPSTSCSSQFSRQLSKVDDSSPAFSL
jgi:hypothetical protein